MQRRILEVTPAAAARARELLSKAPEGTIGLRVGVRKRGCSGQSYVVEYASDRKRFEDEVTVGDVRILVDPASTMYLIGTVMDWQEDVLQSAFTFRNPNERGRCGCGESFHV